MKQTLLDYQDQLAAQGLTTVVEAGLSDLGQLEALRRLDREGRLKVRFLIRVGWGCIEQAAAMGLKTGSGSEWVKILGVKLYSDGWLGPRTAALREPYEDRPHSGFLFLGQPRADADVARARELGFNITTHAIGDRGLETMLTAYEHDGVGEGERAQLEHAQVLGDDLIDRMARVGAIASVQLSFATTDMRFAESALGQERAARAYAWRTLIDRGVRLAGGSDFPVEQINPLWGVQRIVTRQEFDGTPPGGRHPDQRLTVEQALRLITADGALARMEEHERGKLEPGRYADLVVIRENLLSLPADCLAAGTVSMTVANGKVAFEGERAYPPGDATCPSGRFGSFSAEVVRVGGRRVQRLGSRRRAFNWRAGRPPAGWYVLRLRAGRHGVREVAVRRERGLLQVRPAFAHTRPCGPIPAFRLSSPLFGQEPLDVAYRLADTARATYSVRLVAERRGRAVSADLVSFRRG